jgi:hypothetical protein
MSELSHKQKFRLIVRHFERSRASSDGDSVASPKVLARNACGLSRTLAHYVEKGHRDVKNLKKLEQFENVFRTKIVAEPGSPDYQKLWADVRAIVDGTRSDPQFGGYVVPAAYGHWSQIALDPSKSDAQRILAGRMAEFVLFHYGRRRNNGLSNTLVVQVELTAARERGRQVIETLIGVLASNLTPPAGLFDHGSETAREQGYRMLRIRLLADYIGWQGTAATSDAERAQVFAQAYQAGQAAELMWLHEELEGADVGHPNNAFVLATHASDWQHAAEYGISLLKAFPALLTESVGGLSPLLADRTVWPGIAAMMLHRWLDIPTEVRRVLDEPGPDQMTAVRRIRHMVAGVKAGQPYKTVLEIGA